MLQIYQHTSSRHDCPHALIRNSRRVFVRLLLGCFQQILVTVGRPTITVTPLLPSNNWRRKFCIPKYGPLLIWTLFENQCCSFSSPSIQLLPFLYYGPCSNLSSRIKPLILNKITFIFTVFLLLCSSPTGKPPSSLL